MSAVASAGVIDDLLQGLHEIDINDYAIGVGASSTESVYAGAPDSTAAYPYIGRLFPSDFDDGVLFSRARGYGLRWLPSDAWELGAVARVQTLGFDSGDSPVLAGLPSREWTIEAGPTIGTRGATRFDWTAFVDLLRNHGGASHLFRVSAPVQYPHAYFIPEFAIHHYTDAFVDYYYGVPPGAAVPAYTGRAATGMSLGVGWGVAVTTHWLLSGRVDVEYFGSGIADSPIVDDRDSTFFSLQLAYDGTPFHAPDALAAKELPAASIAFAAAGIHPTDAIERREETDSLLDLDAAVSVGRFHNVELGLRDTVYAATSAGRLELRMLRLGYGFTLVRDRQKELTLTAGIHVSRLELEPGELGLPGGLPSASLSPRPVIGARALAHFTGKLTVTGTAEWLMLAGDRYSGRQIFVSVGLLHRTFERTSLGAGYVFNRVSLGAGDPALAALEPVYRGPSLAVVRSLGRDK
ncbi:MAG TPA: MipA/OmpV family protein [Gammaproteobacteria bacterium]|nr:MipA/OmpV family protein [Gammaproteobacteria bacterium]